MYEFSRAIYRELADEITEDLHTDRQNGNRERVLRACEAVVERMAKDRHYFAHPARSLFREIRVCAPVRGEENRVSGCRSRATAIAPRTSTSPRPKRRRRGSPRRGAVVAGDT